MLAPFLLLASAPLGALAADVLKTTGFSNCQANSDIKVQKLDIEFDKTTKKITFDVAGSSSKEQKVMATLVVSAYGKEVYRNKFNPCDESTKVPDLCPGKRPWFGWTRRSTDISQYRPATLQPKECRAFPTPTSRKSLPSPSVSPILTARQHFNSKPSMAASS